jgi:hypothetical protein
MGGREVAEVRAASSGGPRHERLWDVRPADSGRDTAYGKCLPSNDLGGTAGRARNVQNKRGSRPSIG